MSKRPPSGGLPKRCSRLQAQLAANRAQFYLICDGPSTATTERAKPSKRHSKLVAPGHDGRHQAHYDGIVASPRPTRARPEEISVPTLVMHGDDDQIVPYATPALSAKLLKNAP